ncbi:MAG: cation:proton antiporter [Cyclobacteriaceae bacterium]
MDIFNPYVESIVVCLVIVLSYAFSIISRRTNIPSVLLLIGLGVGIQQGLRWMELDTGNALFPILEILGIFGLIMIVLEAALDLELTREKLPLIGKSLGIALVALIGTSLAIAYLLHYFILPDFLTALVYAVPLSVMSSAIIIPSVASLSKTKQEFLIYESTFSDILGIMYFYFLIGNLETQHAGAVVADVSLNIVGTIIISIVLGYVLVWFFQQLTTQVKLFLLIAVLVLLYSVGKLFHLSSLVIILIFGLMLNNYPLFFRNRLKSWIKPEVIDETLEDFHLVTMESAFVVRTFFFVVFGMTLDLTSLLDQEVLMIGFAIVAVTYLIRWICLKVVLLRNIIPELWVAPRGLITILLFFAIPIELATEQFNSGILLTVVLTTSIIMTVALIAKSEPEEKVHELSFDSWDELDEAYEKAVEDAKMASEPESEVKEA